MNNNRNRIILDILPTDDYIFGVKENKDILLSFLNSLFWEFNGFPLILNLSIENNEISKYFANIRESRFDIILTTNDNSSINVEMQLLIFLIWFIPYNGSYKNPKAISIWILKDNI